MSDVVLELPEVDRPKLVQLEKKIQLVRDEVAGVACGHQTGFLLTGRPGISKTWTIEDELKRRGVTYVPSRSHLTGRGLFDQLADYPDRVHVIDDIEEALRDPQATGVLKAALWSSTRDREGRMARRVAWRAHGVDISIIFTGGLVMTSNIAWKNLPLISAIRSRIPVMNLLISDEELAAKMREIALQGYQAGTNRLEPTECIEVLDHCLEEASANQRPLDLRLLINSFEVRLQVENGESGCGWKDRVASRILQRPSIIGPIEPFATRAVKKARELEIAREIVELDPDARLRVWQAKVAGAGGSRATMYRRLQELAQKDAIGLDS